jgi:hypothetical protein
MDVHTDPTVIRTHAATLATLVHYLEPDLVRLVCRHSERFMISFRTPELRIRVTFEAEGGYEAVRLRYGSGRTARTHKLRWENVGPPTRTPSGKEVRNVAPTPDAAAKAIAFVKRTLIAVDTEHKTKQAEQAEAAAKQKANNDSIERALGLPLDTKFRLYVAGVEIVDSHADCHTADTGFRLDFGYIENETDEKVIGAVLDALRASGALTIVRCDEEGKPIVGTPPTPPTEVTH